MSVPASLVIALLSGAVIALFGATWVLSRALSDALEMMALAEALHDADRPEKVAA